MIISLVGVGVIVVIFISAILPQSSVYNKGSKSFVFELSHYFHIGQNLEMRVHFPLPSKEPPPKSSLPSVSEKVCK